MDHFFFNIKFVFVNYPIFCGWAPFQERHTLKWSRELFAGASSTGARPNGSSDAASIAVRRFFWVNIKCHYFMLLLLGKIFGNSFFFRQTCIQPLRQTVEDHCGCFCLSTGLTIPSAGRISIFSTTLHDLFVDGRAPECGWPETGHENFWTRTRHLAARQTGWRSLSGGHCTYWQRRPSAYAERAEQLAIFVPVAVAFAVWEGEILGNT